MTYNVSNVTLTLMYHTIPRFVESRLNPITQLKKLMQKPLFTEADVSRLMQLGYTKAVSVYALEACHGNINKACDMLLECGSV